MSIVKTIAGTRPGDWLRKRANRPGWRGPIRSVWHLGKWLDLALRRCNPTHLAHDRRQVAILKAFEHSQTGKQVKASSSGTTL